MPVAHGTRPSRWVIAAAIVPPLVIGLIGTTHPSHLTQDIALRWRDLHVVLLPLFPLLAVGPWLVARSVDLALGRLSLLLGFVYACFYTALDVLAGIGAGGIKHANQSGLGVLFGLASDLGQVGSIAFIGATALASGCMLRVNGYWALPGALLAIVGAYGFMEEHIYWPGGVLSMWAIAAGWALMLIVRPQRAGTSSLA